MNRALVKIGLCISTILCMQSCSSVTVLRTHELERVGQDVTTDVHKQLDSLKLAIDSLQTENLRAQRRMMAEIGLLNTRLSDATDKLNSRQEEMLYRLDLLVGSSSKPIKRVVVDKHATATSTNAPTTSAPDTSTQSPTTSDVASNDPELDALYAEARGDFSKSEYKLAYDAFKSVYEKAKIGDYAENALYWMGLCLTETQQQEKALVVFNRVLEQFPTGKKTCVVLLKLADIAANNGKKDDQLQLLQRLTAQPQCRESNEAYKAIEILDQLKPAKAK